MSDAVLPLLFTVGLFLFCGGAGYYLGEWLGVVVMVGVAMMGLAFVLAEADQSRKK